MSRRRVKKKRPPRNGAAANLFEFFFEGGDPMKPRGDMVTRDELWRVLEWYTHQILERNTWRRRLWRSLRRWPAETFDPFAAVKIARLRIRRAQRAKARAREGS